MADNQPSINPVEEWRDVPGWEGLYQVSDHGRVRSVDRVMDLPSGQTRRYKSRILKHGIHPAGHHLVSLYQGGKRTTQYVHVLVAEAFIGPRAPGEEALHHDDNPDNNHVRNITWGTRSENIRDMIRNGKHYQANQTHCKRGHAFTPDNINKNGPNGRACRTCNRDRSREWRKKRQPVK